VPSLEGAKQGQGTGGAHPMQETGSEASKSTGAASVRHSRPARERIIAAMLALSGELGYRRATVRRVLELSGATHAQFYLHFRSREDCFAAAYEGEAEPLYRALLAAAARQSSWREGLRGAVTELFRFVAERPLIARAILNQVYVAGGAALVKHEEYLERLSRAVDGACRETSESRHALPPPTAPFIIGAIEEFVRFRLAEPDRLWAALPELMHLATAPYLGDQVAREELRRPAPPGLD
jgi:AcrR family transcriptional regulator